MARKKEEIIFEVEDAYDVPEDTVFVLDANGNSVKMEVPDDADDDQA